MSQRSDVPQAADLTATLPERVFTRCGASFDPRLDVWEWFDGPFRARLDFGRYVGRSQPFVPSLKLALLPFVKGHSTSHVTNLNAAFSHFVSMLGPRHRGPITAKQISNYAAKLGEQEVGRLGTLNGLLQKWVSLGLWGVTKECANYLKDRKKPGNRKGDAVRTRNPVHGPFSEAEYTALHAALNDAYGRGVLPLWTLLLGRLFLACGGRVSQYASLKIEDFDCDSFVLNLPQGKTGEKHSRTRFLQFDISPQTGRLIRDYFAQLQELGFDKGSAFFPTHLVMPKGPRVEHHQKGNMFYGHCISSTLASHFKILVDDIAPPTARLDFATLPISTKRFRYTLGTRLAEEGASQVVIANRLGHADLQNVGVYVEASPRVIENIDNAMGELLAPLAQAFRGRLIESESQSTHRGAPGSRIIDFRVSNDAVGSCAGKGGGCMFNKPVACYTCFRFEPWLDAPHALVLNRLMGERNKAKPDDRVAAINDAPIRAIQEVIAQCADARRQRGEPGVAA